jgi:hypothetical protein
MALLLMADSLDRQTLNAVSDWLQRQSPLVPVLLPIEGVPSADVNVAIIASAFPDGIAYADKREMIVADIAKRVAGIKESTHHWVPGVVMLTSSQDEVPHEALGAACKELEGAVSLPVWAVNLVNGQVAEAFPQWLQEVFDKAGTVSSLPGLLELPLFVDAAGGIPTARTLLRTGVERRANSEDAFLGEVLDVFKKVLMMWGPDAAASWLRSPNGSLNGARPIQVLALNGPQRVLESLDVVPQFVYS